MFGRMKDVAVHAMSKQKDGRGDSSVEYSASSTSKRKKPEKYVYARPYFLGLDKEEVQHSQDFGMRPILKPRKISEMPLLAGYAECINGGKSDNNEDNSYACNMCIRSRPLPNASNQSRNSNTSTGSRTSNSSGNQKESSMEQAMVDVASMKPSLDAVYFGLFDGHAGYQTSLITSRNLHSHVQNQLSMCADLIIEKACRRHNRMLEDEFDELANIHEDVLIIGAIEEAFQLMDDQLKIDNMTYNVKGGCTALTVLFLNGKIYIANAGDCRAVLCHGDVVKPVSRDFTPESEKQRLYQMGNACPELLRGEFSCVEYPRRVNRVDIGTQMLCRQPGRSGWAYKTIDEDDLKFPLVNGFGKNARIMATIGVSRGLGDHDLYVYDSDIWIKPFLSCQPEVQVIDLHNNEYSDTDVLILGSDGLWDVISNEQAASLVHQAISNSEKNDKNRYTIAAQELVAEARGKFTGQGWKKNNGVQASFDDISAFVIPIHCYLENWKKQKLFSNSAEDQNCRL